MTAVRKVDVQNLRDGTELSDRSWPFLPVNNVFNRADWHFRFGPESGRSDMRVGTERMSAFGRKQPLVNT